MTTGKVLPLKLDNIGDIIFGEEHVVFYTETDQQNRPYKVTKLDVDTGESECIFIDDDPTHYVDIGTTKDKKYIIIASNTKEDSEIWVIERSKNTEQPLPRKLLSRQKNVTFHVDHIRDFFIGITRQNKKMKLLKCFDNSSKWSDLLPFQD